MQLRPGLSINDRLQLTRPLGAGGMGSVWAAVQTALDSEVAVKFVAAELTGNPEMLERFKREAKTAAQIKSPHVVQMFDHGVTADGTAYIVMELLVGESLAVRLRREEALALEQVTAIFEQLARALSAAHEIDIVHRDIKPDNLFLVRTPGAPESDVHVKVLDFGIARHRDSDAPMLTKTGAVFGTPAFMSPEQLDDTRNAGPEADLWAAAVVAYQALTGKLPFAGDSAVSLWRSIQAGKYAPASELRPGLPVELDAWFSRAFAFERTARFESARAMADALHAASRPDASTPRTSVALGEAKTELALPSTGPIAGAPPSSATRTVLLVLLVTFALGVAVIAYLSFSERDPPPTPPNSTVR